MSRSSVLYGLVSVKHLTGRLGHGRVVNSLPDAAGGAERLSGESNARWDDYGFDCHRGGRA
jgi:hypothetical protein